MVAFILAALKVAVMHVEFLSSFTTGLHLAICQADTGLLDG